MVRWTGLIASFAMLIAGCANSPPLVDRVSRGKVEGDIHHVSIAEGRVDALPLAVFHCAKYGRSAQWSHAEGDRSVYNCVTRN